MSGGASRDDGAAVDQATAISMDRYDMSETEALDFLQRVARRQEVALGVVAVAVVAAAVARRKRLVLSPAPRPRDPK